MKVLSNNTFGLHRRQTYEELVGEIGKPLLTAYPDRKAINLRFSNWLSQLDAEGVKTMEQQQLNAMKEQEKQNLLREYAMTTGTSHAVARASSEAPDDTYHEVRDRPSYLPSAASTPEMFDIHSDDDQPPPPPPPQGSLIPNLETRQQDWDELRGALQAVGTQQQLMDHATQLQRLQAQNAGFHALLRDLPAVSMADRAYVHQIEGVVRQHQHQLEQVQRRQASHSQLLPQITDTVHALVQHGGSSSSRGPLADAIRTPVGPDIPGELSSAVSVSSEETVPTTHTQMTREQRYIHAVTDLGKPKETYPTADAWKQANRNRKGEYQVQMWLRKMPWTPRMSINKMIRKLLEYDHGGVRQSSGPEEEHEPRGRRGRPRNR